MGVGDPHQADVVFPALMRDAISCRTCHGDRRSAEVSVCLRQHDRNRSRAAVSPSGRG